ncbi:MAG: bifunctional adenosylcobinamide kinase/adenosylcobinamide-phosphate guanylyltransferase [Nanoarchaeota archaeon]|nr:bifunctional adenosylcobinamide kinase/adenosylcobinamide-phosphate guanylyltransferase [Nanoarchaeota archaeon]
MDLNLEKGINLVYGESATGKTTLAMELALKEAKDNKVIFIDTERSFSIERVKQLDKDYDKKLKNICVFRVNDFEEQCRCFKKLLNIKNTKLIIVDTLGFFYRLELKQDPRKINKQIDDQLQILSELSKDCGILITNQVYKNIDTNKIEVVGGKMIKNWSKSIIRLEKNPRKLIFEKPEIKEINFKIVDSGLVIL